MLHIQSNSMLPEITLFLPKDGQESTWTSNIKNVILKDFNV